MTDTCYLIETEEQTCVQCPEVLAVTGVPEVIIVDNNFGWNSSAYSGAQIAGDCYTQFTVPAAVAGVFCGLADARVDNSPSHIPFAFYIYQHAGAQLWAIWENGVQKTSPVVRVPETDTFRIERRAGKVTYFFNGHVYYTSVDTTLADLVVVACMYAAGDGVD
jgi:hypothetical protein